MKTALKLVERGLVPTPLVRHGIRKLLDERLREQRSIHDPDLDGALADWVKSMNWPFAKDRRLEGSFT